MYGHIVGNWARIAREEAHLKAEEEAAAKLEQEAFACRMRIRKQQKILCEKAGKMLQHDLYIIEALEKFEAKEKRLEEKRLENECVEKEKEQAGVGSSTLAKASLNILNNFDPSSFLNPSDPFWEGLDSIGEIPSTNQEYQGSF